ncbi:MAG: Arm DNA-binding domain-containing protein [Mesorhizobium sp.]
MRTAEMSSLPKNRFRFICPSFNQGRTLIAGGGKTQWQVMAYRFNGKQKTLSLGIYPAVSLKDARDHRSRAKELLARGVDPGEHKKQEKRKKEESSMQSNCIA